MDSNNIIISIIYYVGIASCAIQGAEKGKFVSKYPVLHFIENAFGGGFIRDVTILCVHPWLFTPAALCDVVWVIVIGTLFTYCFFICKTDKKIYNTVMRLTIIADTLGLGSFICIGMDKLYKFNNNALLAILCGYITAIGGGILASRKPLTKIFNNKETVHYHIVTVLGCCFYHVFRHSLLLVLFVTIDLFFANKTEELYYITLNLHELLRADVKIFLLYPTMCSEIKGYNNLTEIKMFNNIYVTSRKKFILYNRIRQC